MIGSTALWLFEAVFTILKPNGEDRLDTAGSKSIKLHLCITKEGIILSHVFTTANRNDAAIVL
jgi:hypothetical protein